jgi:hypothetical protein
MAGTFHSRQRLLFSPEASLTRVILCICFHSGWNNIRMAMESVIGLAVATGRTLVMPPQKKM